MFKAMTEWNIQRKVFGVKVQYGRVSCVNTMYGVLTVVLIMAKAAKTEGGALSEDVVRLSGIHTDCPLSNRQAEPVCYR